MTDPNNPKVLPPARIMAPDLIRRFMDDPTIAVKHCNLVIELCVTQEARDYWQEVLREVVRQGGINEL